MLSLKHTLMIVTAIGLTGCGTSGKKGDQPTAGQPTADSKAYETYVEGLNVMAMSKASSDSCLGSASEMKGKSWKSLVRHANGCVKAGDWRKLELTAQEMATAEVSSPWGAYYYSLAAENTLDLPRALWMADLALKKTPNAPLFKYQKGRVLWKLNHHREAMEEISAAAKRDPKLSDANVFLAQVYHRDMLLDKAAGHYEQALTVDGRNRVSLEGLADIRFGQGKNEKAAELYTEAVASAGDDMRLRVKLAQAHEAIPANQELALANYRAAREISKSRKVALEFDLNDKIKTLETKVHESKVGKQAKADGEKEKLDGKRMPGAESQKRTTK